MKQICVIFVAAFFAAVPAQAQDNGSEMDQGFDLLQEGTRLLLEGLMKEIGPVLLELKGQIIDLNNYHFPEILPNGDIIIRRKIPAVPEQDGDIDL